MFITGSMAPVGFTRCSMMMLYDDSEMEPRHLTASTRKPFHHSSRTITKNHARWVWSLKSSSSKYFDKQRTPLAMPATEQNRHAIANSNG